MTCAAECFCIDYLTVNVACNFAHEHSEYTGKSIGLLHLQTPMGNAYFSSSPMCPPLLKRRSAVVGHWETMSLDEWNKTDDNENVPLTCPAN